MSWLPSEMAFDISDINGGDVHGIEPEAGRSVFPMQLLLHRFEGPFDNGGAVCPFRKREEGDCNNVVLGHDSDLSEHRRPWPAYELGGRPGTSWTAAKAPAASSLYIPYLTEPSTYTGHPPRKVTGKAAAQRSLR